MIRKIVIIRTARQIENRRRFSAVYRDACVLRLMWQLNTSFGVYWDPLANCVIFNTPVRSFTVSLDLLSLFETVQIWVGGL